MPEFNIYVGYAHGFLFLAYITLAIVVYAERDWKWPMLVKLLAASVLPFGTFYLDKYYLRAR